MHPSDAILMLSILLLQCLQGMFSGLYSFSLIIFLVLQLQCLQRVFGLFILQCFAHLHQLPNTQSHPYIFRSLLSFPWCSFVWGLVNVFFFFPLLQSGHHFFLLNVLSHLGHFVHFSFVVKKWCVLPSSRIISIFANLSFYF